MTDRRNTAPMQVLKLLLLLLNVKFAMAGTKITYKAYASADCSGDAIVDEEGDSDVDAVCVNYFSTFSIKMECTSDSEVKYQLYSDTDCDTEEGDEVVTSTGQCNTFTIRGVTYSQRFTCESTDDPCFASSTTHACRLLDSSVSAQDAFDACFVEPAASDKAKRVLMASLRAGDRVLSASDGVPTSTNVIVNQHAAEDKTSSLIHMYHADGKLSVTADHAIYLNGKFVPARNAKPGDMLASAALEPVEIERLTSSRGGIINPITADGKILAASEQGAPVLVATANEWLADVLLSSYPKYTLSFWLAAAFPNAVQAYYDSLLEPFFTRAVPSLTKLKMASPTPVVAAGLILGDILLALGLLAFTLCSYKGLVAVAAVTVMAVYRRRVLKTK